MPAPDFKRLVKKLAPAQAETVGIDTEKGQLYAANADLTIVVNDKSLLGADGVKVAVSGEQFLSVASRTSGEVSVSFVDGRLIVRSKRATFDLATTTYKQISSEFPSEFHSLPFPGTKEILQFASSASDNTERNNFTGAIELATNEDGYRVQAAGTNFQRLALASMELPEKMSFKLLLPVIAVQALDHVEASYLRIADGGSQIYLGADETTIIARKLVKPFPDFGHLLKAEPTFIANLNAETVLESLKQIQPIVKENDSGSRVMDMHFSDLLKLSTSDGRNRAEDELEYDPVEPDPLFVPPDFTIKIDHRYLTEFFSDIKGTIVFGGVEPNSPITLTTSNRKMMICTIGRRK